MYEHAKVVNIDKESYEVFIGRPSKWGNPFKIGEDYTRQEAIDKHAEWIMHQAELLRQIGELKGKILGCYCKPEICHGDILLKLANEESRA
jgi:hypothetical protein